MPVQLKAAVLDDLPLLLTLGRAYYALDRLPYDEEQAETALRGLIAHPACGRLWLVQVDGEGAGYIVLTLGYSIEYGGIDAFIDELYLSPPYRGRGYGSRVLELVETEARALGVRALHLEVERSNEAAHRLYLRLGFASNDRHLLSKRLGGDAA